MKTLWLKSQETPHHQISQLAAIAPNTLLELSKRLSSKGSILQPQEQGALTNDIEAKAKTIRLIPRAFIC